MATVRNSRVDASSHISNSGRLKAIRYWRFTESRLVCNFIKAKACVPSTHSNDPTGSDNDSAWEDVEAALVPGTSRKGDVICRIFGCPTPVVLRKLPYEYEGKEVYQARWADVCPKRFSFAIQDRRRGVEPIRCRCRWRSLRPPVRSHQTLLVLRGPPRRCPSAHIAAVMAQGNMQTWSSIAIYLGYMSN